MGLFSFTRGDGEKIPALSSLPLSKASGPADRSGDGEAKFGGGLAARKTRFDGLEKLRAFALSVDAKARQAGEAGRLGAGLIFAE